MKNVKNRRVAVLMAGGSGERFWPVSRRTIPKQFLNLTRENLSLYEQTLDRIANIFPLKDIFSVSGTRHVDTIRKAQTGIPDENIIAEPFKRNTSGCIALAAAELLADSKGDGSGITMGVFPADNYVMYPDRFKTSVEAALRIAESEDALVTFGIKPDRPETGYGYIEAAGEAETTTLSIPVYSVARFCEKPDSETAQKYITSGKFYWNSGMFFWRLSTFLNELSHASPDLLRAIEIMSEALASGDSRRFTSVFEGIEDISIDYTLMEKARSVMVLETDFGWDDIGAWDALERTYLPDENGNVTVGDPVLIDTRNSIVFNDSGSEKTTVGVIGIDGLAVVVSDDGVLVVPKERAQDVKKVVSELKKRNSKQI